MWKRYILQKEMYQTFIRESVLADCQRPRSSLVGSEFPVFLLAAAINGAVSTVIWVHRKDVKK